MVRIFDGERFIPWDATRLKSQAQDLAEQIRQRGARARVIEDTSVPRGDLKWIIYVNERDTRGRI